MKTDKDLHLSEEQLIKALVDANDLPSALREHLARCPVCRIDKERFEHRLERLGREAMGSSPAPQRRILLPTDQSEKKLRLSWRMKSTLGMASLCVLILFAVVSDHFSTVQEPADKTAAQQNPSKANALMTEVGSLSENALPPEYLIMTGELDEVDEEDEEDEFMDFMMTLDNKDTSKIHSQRVGGLLCTKKC